MSSSEQTPVAVPTDCRGWAAELLPRLKIMAGRRYGIPAQDCEDVVHSAVVDYLVQSGRYPTADPGLLVVIARRRCIDFWRSRQMTRAHFVALDSLPSEDPLLGRGDEYALGLMDGIGLALAWLKITPRCRQLLAERFFRRRTATELAAAAGDPPGAVKRFMSRCLERLRTVLDART